MSQSKHTFQTARLQFSPLVTSDAPALYNDLRTAPEVMKWSRQGHIDYNVNDTISWISKLREGTNVSPSSPETEEKEAGSKLVGTVFSIRELDYLHQQQQGAEAGETKEDKVIGTIGVRLTESELAEGEQFEIGYMFVPSSWGKGYATEAVRGFVPWWFDFSANFLKDHDGETGSEGVDKDGIYAVVAKENVPSLRVMEKCGFRVHAQGQDEDGTGIVEYCIARSNV
ncbi:GNAT domain-containing protein [Aspergillus karnatakaensis]|uniref:GNAT family N-acetyltransferase n=1 Tax=Aspergillus karnatakaensis TaxID=1810916 RepID=UPI003CCD9FCE